MNRLIMLAVAVFALSQGTLSAQDVPRTEFFMGYSLRTLDDCCPSSLHGWSASLAFNPTRNFGLVADFGGHYGTISGSRKTTLEYMIGPRVNFRKENLTLFGHVLGGGLHYRGSDSFAMGYGGGIDLRLSNRIDVRVIQFDMLIPTQGTLMQPRLGFGMVLKGSQPSSQPR